MATSVDTRVRLGRSELQVSPIAFGTWQLGGEWGSFDEQRAVEAIRHARGLGINFFDTAQAYGFGASERLLGEALEDELRNHRDEVVIATKGGLRPVEGGIARDSSPGFLRQGVEASLEALGIETIDLYQVHWPDPDTPLAESGRALAELVEEGKIRHVGVSNYSAEQMAELTETVPVETLQPPYHLFAREVEDAVLPWCYERDVGVLVYSPLAHGLLTGAITEDTEFADDDWRGASPMFRAPALLQNLRVVDQLRDVAGEVGCTVSQLAIAWTLANPAVQVAIVGSRRPEHIAESVGALEVELGERELQWIAGIMEGAVTSPGPSPEPISEQ
ncbi:MAG TPA: aldo/keto reductase [Thermoleophilaceae bacterium]|nr:aldo/keto reductase [Thermoleophilaceae bacterium]